MTVAVATCACGAELDPHEGGQCAFCRMADRGDGQLVAHDDRGWIDLIKKVRGRAVVRRVACGCGCNMAAAPAPEPEPDRAPTVIPPMPSTQGTRSEEELLDLIRDWVRDYGSPPSIEQWKAKRHERSLPSWTAMQARFGTWNGAIRAAGFEPYMGGRRHRGGWKPKPIPGSPTPDNLERLAAATKAMQKGKDPREKAEQEHEAAARSFKQELAALTRRAAAS